MLGPRSPVRCRQPKKAGYVSWEGAMGAAGDVGSCGSQAAGATEAGRTLLEELRAALAVVVQSRQKRHCTREEGGGSRGFRRVQVSEGLSAAAETRWERAKLAEMGYRSSLYQRFDTFQTATRAVLRVPTICEDDQ